MLPGDQSIFTSMKMPVLWETRSGKTMNCRIVSTTADSSSVLVMWLVLTVMGVLISMSPIQVEAGGYSAALEAASLVEQGQVDLASAPVNNSKLGLPYRTGYHFQPKSHWMNGKFTPPEVQLQSTWVSWWYVWNIGVEVWLIHWLWMQV